MVHGKVLSFLAHLIDFYQMCYCCRKLENIAFSGGRPICEADLWGRAPLIGLEICLSQSGVPGSQIGLTDRPPTSASQSERPISLNSASQAVGLPEFLMWSVWANQSPTASQIGLTDWEAEVGGQSVRQICEAVGVRSGRPICEAEVPIGLSRVKQCI